MIQFQEYLQSDYPGFTSFIDTIIKEIFKDAFRPDKDLQDMIDYPEDIDEFDKIANSKEEIVKTLAAESGLLRLLELGTIHVQGDTRPIHVYDITISDKRLLSRNRKGIQQLITRILNNQSGAFMLFHYANNNWEWRFSYKYVGKDKEDSTDSKRFTYLFGRDQVCKTAAQRFLSLKQKKGAISFDDIKDAFSVEKISKEFFEKYKVQYGKFVGYVIGKEYIDKGEGKGEWHDKAGLTPSELFAGLNEDEKRVRDYVKKLLGRIVFLHFLQKKGWLGATDEGWTNGPQDFMKRLFESATDVQKANFLDEILEPLYSQLDTPLDKRPEVYDTQVEGFHAIRVPFLGGLFERTQDDEADSVFPSELFAGLFQFLSEYNFTIVENDPNDAQVGVDPEMLGRIFENLLEDNKDKGAFYTPKEIVQYMCRESLIAYLQTNITDEPIRESLRKFVLSHDANELGGKDSALAQNVSERLKDVKICDPAIGSGAFPMGLLNELFLCRCAIEDISNTTEIKRHIIQQNIYGVDIEKGAVEIARLRFWLSLITDADKPDVLPNMDFKIMQGNSLLEQYKKFDLSHIMDTKREITAGHQVLLFEESVDVIRALVKDTLKRYYNEPNNAMRKSMREGIKERILEQMEVQGISVDMSDIDDIAETNQFFLWHTWFSDVFEEGGFDIVIGNPPYVDIKGMPQKDIKQYFEIFKTCENRINLYAIFIEKAFSLLANNGIICFINPNSMLVNSSYTKLRRMLVEDIGLIVKLPDTVFETAIVETIIFLAIRHNPFKQVPTYFCKNNDVVNLSDLNYRSYSREDWSKDDDIRFNIFIDSKVSKLLSKIRQDSCPLEN